MAMTTENQIPRKRLRDPEAARYIGMSTMWLRKKRMDGDGPPVIRLGRAVRYDTDDLDRWLESKKVNP